MAKRSDTDRLKLLVRIVERIGREPAWGQGFSVEIRFENGQQTVRTEEPERTTARSLLMEVRKLDSRGSDAFLPDLFDIVERDASSAADRRSVRRIRRVYQALQTTDDIQLDDGRGVLSARDAFELWAYGEHLHDDLDKEARIAAMPLEMATFVRHNAIRYMQKLVHMAAFLRATVLTDPAFGLSARDIG